ncbi:uncharacterized protein [Dermacentor andersoni]|uniref:uncharacterized protein n=1 Tax=Dermacentor andersoni TaxID=34620 RepID=UPI00241806F4|nr:uncharacterized protein LOC126540650 [Dermacentor andersoni]
MTLTKVFHVVRRRLWLQSVQRHYFALVLEVISVAGLSRIIIPSDTPGVDPQRLTARPEPIIYDAYEADKQILHVLAVVYRPKNTETDNLIQKAFGQGRSTTVTPLTKKPEVEPKCREEWAKYGTRGQVVCVEFADVFGVTGGGSLDYELLQAAPQVVPDHFPLTGPKSFSLEATDSLKNYFDLILVEQAKIDHHFLKKSKKTTAQDQQQINGLPAPAFWLGHFLSAFSVQMVESAIIIGIMFFAESHAYTTFYRHVDVSLLIFVMILFNTEHILLAMVVAAVLKKGNRAMFGAVFLGFFLPLFTAPDQPSLSKFVFQDRWSKLMFCIYPQIGCSTVLRTLAIFDDYHGESVLHSGFKKLEALLTSRYLTNYAEDLSC